MSTGAEEWLAPARCPRPLHRVRCWRNSHEWGIQLCASLYPYDGVTLHVDVGLLSLRLALELRLFYSQRMLRRSWDRWNAESLAGEHPGVAVHVREAQ